MAALKIIRSGWNMRVNVCMARICRRTRTRVNVGADSQAWPYSMPLGSGMPSKTWSAELPILIEQRPDASAISCLRPGGGKGSPRVTSKSLCSRFSEKVVFNVMTECGSS